MLVAPLAPAWDLFRRRDGIDNFPEPPYGEKFEREVDRMIDLIRDYPKSGSLLSGYPGLELRSYPIRTFLYSLVVGFDDDRPVIYAVAHQSREPGYWSARILP